MTLFFAFLSTDLLGANQVGTLAPNIWTASGS